MHMHQLASAGGGWRTCSAESRCRMDAMAASRSSRSSRTLRSRTASSLHSQRHFMQGNVDLHP